ncbi:hypothetical protein F2P81_024243 [Scophthalmus maximus]|uniref:Uncharacterized protein n=1 Tax=Scophthalmus maximus TaxID=52904 RepID=A0A6A4RP00_SCOMX|nr:hypothetical protein F2P81_024243 [Scophthalmus maximus]
MCSASSDNKPKRGPRTKGPRVKPRLIRAALRKDDSIGDTEVKLKSQAQLLISNENTATRGEILPFQDFSSFSGDADVTLLRERR